MKRLLTILSAFFMVLVLNIRHSVAEQPPTPAEVEAKVDAAIKLLETEGEAAIAKIKDKNGEFVFKGTYIWIHDDKGTMVMHPFKPAMDGKDLIGLQDVNGKAFFAVMNDLVSQKGSGWVDYMWPRIDGSQPVQKVSYVKGVKVGERKLILGCGLYDVPEAEIAKLVK